MQCVVVSCGNASTCTLYTAMFCRVIQPFQNWQTNGLAGLSTRWQNELRIRGLMMSVTYAECIEPFTCKKAHNILTIIFITFVRSQDLTLLFTSSFVFISHLTNFPSFSVFMYVAWFFFCLTLPLRKNLLGSKRKPLTFILQYIILCTCVYMTDSCTELTVISSQF